VKDEMDGWMLPVIFLLIIGGLAGYFAGHLVKKVSTMALTIGVFILVVITMAYIGNVDLNLDAMVATVSSVVEAVTPLGILSLLTSIPFVASFIAGLFMGYNRT
jgi:uncharacterized membrane protein (Fun14 family)